MYPNDSILGKVESALYKIGVAGLIIGLALSQLNSKLFIPGMILLCVAGAGLVLIAPTVGCALGDDHTCGRSSK